MLNVLKSLFSNGKAAETVDISRDKLFQACRSVLQVNGLRREPVSYKFKLSVGQSKLPNAGYGIIVSEGRINKGDVVALYSGTYFPPPPVWSVASIDGEPAIKPFQINNVIATAESEEAKERAAAYQIHCNNEGGYIDGKEFTPYAENTTSGDHQVLRIHMPYSSAQLINHPGPGIRPNVSMHDFSWAEYLEYVKKEDSAVDVQAEKERIGQINTIGEGRWYFDPTTNKVVPLTPDCTNCVGLATIAQTDIEAGEEVYLDYKYHKDDRPSWYTPVKYD